MKAGQDELDERDERDERDSVSNTEKRQSCFSVSRILSTLFIPSKRL
jgi:hypothetical protein